MTVETEMSELKMAIDLMN